MRKYLAILLLAVVPMAALHASPGDDIRFRADDQGLWHLEDNPALLGTATNLDGLMMGVAYDAMDPLDAGLPDGNFGQGKAAVFNPLIGYFGLHFESNSFDLVYGSGFSLGKALAIGGDFAWSATRNVFTAYEAGLLLRPASFLSLGLTGGLRDTGSYEGGLGIAVRPLALAGMEGPRSRALTLNADLSLSQDEGFNFDNMGVRLLLSNSADLRAWYAPPEGSFAGPFGNGRIGIELRLALGAEGISALTPSAAATPLAWRVADDVDIRLSEIKASASGLPSTSIGRRILVVKDIDSISSVSAQGRNPLAFLSSSRTMDFSELMALLENARRDRGVVAVAFEKLPSLGGASYYEEFAAELGALRKAGKKVYFYGEEFGVEYDIFASVADGITLNPGGALGGEGLGLGFHRDYFKPFFDRLGIRFVNLAPWDTKSAFNSLSDTSMPPPEEAMMRRLFGDIQDQLAASIVAGRGDRLAGVVDAAMRGGPYLVAAEALKAGLVDSLAYEQEFEASLRAAFSGAALVSGLGSLPGNDWGGPAFRRRAAVVWLSGDIGVGKGRAGASIGSDAAREIERLRGDRSVSGIVLRVDSPGGAALASDLIAREVRLTVAAGKPVVVSMAHYAASGGYYLSAPASWIVAEPMTVTGSIGVTGLVPNLAEALKKLGVNYDGFDLAPGASFLDPSKPLDDAELAKAHRMVLAMYDRFVDVVAAGRRLAPEAVRSVAEGQVFSGREALKLGLVDELGGLAEAKAWLERKLGSSLSFEDIFPGDRSPLSGLSPLASAIKAGVEPNEGRSLEALLGPLASRLEGMLAMGQGPLYYLDEDELAF